MAFRRFKPKPKPVINVAVRRTKDNVDLEENSDKLEVEKTIKDSLALAEPIANNSCQGSQSFANDTNLISHHSAGRPNDNNSKSVKSEGSEIYNVISSNSVPTVDNESRPTVTENIKDISAIHNRLTTCSADSTVNKQNEVQSIASDSFKTSTNNVCEIGLQESSRTIIKSSDKPKVPSKFGRFRCKPVLSGTIPRRKPEETNLVNIPVHAQNVNDSDIIEESQTENCTNGGQVEDRFACDSSTQEVLVSDKSVIPSDISQTPVKSSQTTPSKCPPRSLEANRRQSLQAIENEEARSDSKIKESMDTKKVQLMSYVPKKKRQVRTQSSTFARMSQNSLEKIRTKFGEKKPMESEMTMLDLIFYDPKTNPMTRKQVTSSQFKRKVETDNKESDGLLEDILAEQSVDDVEESNQSIPVPQLKVGPDGQIILDPQSLVIDTTDVRKNREILENSEVLEETDTSFCSYIKKRPKRCEWTAGETLQFYRALNTIGTDFALMAQLFPKRTRRDLKMKFKREERLNVHLIDKAVTNPTEFDFNSLEEEIKLEQDIKAQKDADKIKLLKEVKEERARRKKEKETKLVKKKKKLGSRTFKQFEKDDIGEFYPKEKKTKRKRIKKESKENYDESDEEDEEEIINILKQTRSGRIPKHPNSSVKSNDSVKEEEQSNVDAGLFQEPWDLTVHPIADIESNILANSQQDNESVSMISDLGSSFVDEVNMMHTSTDDFLISVDKLTQQLQQSALPPYSSIAKKVRLSDDSNNFIKPRLLTESMQIVDELTSNVEDNKSVNETSMSVLENDPIVITIAPTDDNQINTTGGDIQMPFKIRQKQMKRAQLKALHNTSQEVQLLMANNDKQSTSNLEGEPSDESEIIKAYVVHSNEVTQADNITMFDIVTEDGMILHSNRVPTENLLTLDDIILEIEEPEDENVVVVDFQRNNENNATDNEDADIVHSDCEIIIPD